MWIDGLVWIGFIYFGGTYHLHDFSQIKPCSIVSAAFLRMGLRAPRVPGAANFH